MAEFEFRFKFDPPNKALVRFKFKPRQVIDIKLGFKGGLNLKQRLVHLGGFFDAHQLQNARGDIV